MSLLPPQPRDVDGEPMREQTLYRACGRCGELHDRGKGYSYCRKCATDYQRERRATRGNHSKRIAELELCIKQLSERINKLEQRAAVFGGRS